MAVSRAKRSLVIVDTDSGFDRLWKCVRDEGFESQMLAKIKRGREVWSKQIEGMNVGSPEALTRESAGDPLENAKTFEADGLARRDSGRLPEPQIQLQNMLRQLRTNCHRPPRLLRGTSSSRN